MTSEEILAIAKTTAQTMADRLAAAYVKSVAGSVHAYQHDGFAPDEDDFFAWVEGYDWAPVVLTDADAAADLAGEPRPDSPGFESSGPVSA